MPSLKSRAKPLPANRYSKSEGQGPSVQGALPPMPTPLPDHLTRNARMISSLPPIASSLDAPTRQFYGNNLPKRRISPS
jgi:hypothetical protein